MITSASNSKIQWIRKLQSRRRERQQAKAFPVEGVRLVEEALRAGWETRLVIYDRSLDERGQRLVQAFAGQGVNVEEVTPEVLRAASATETPQGILAVLTLSALPLPERMDLLFIPDGVRDPGNLGTMLRTAAAAGVDAVLLPEGTVDPFSPKVVRAAMGAHFHLPVHSLSWTAIAELLKQAGLRVFLADSGGGVAYTQADFLPPLALIVGGEAQGASLHAEQLAHNRVHIPMQRQTESLNAAIAAAVLLFEINRQRQEKPAPSHRL